MMVGVGVGGDEASLRLPASGDDIGADVADVVGAIGAPDTAADAAIATTAAAATDDGDDEVDDYFLWSISGVDATQRHDLASGCFVRATIIRSSVLQKSVGRAGTENTESMLFQSNSHACLHFPFQPIGWHLHYRWLHATMCVPIW